MPKTIVMGKEYQPYETPGRDEFWSSRDYQEIDALSEAANAKAVCRRCSKSAPQYSSICTQCFDEYYAPDVAVEFPAEYVELPKQVDAVLSEPLVLRKRRKAKPPRDFRIPNTEYLDH